MSATALKNTAGSAMFGGLTAANEGLAGKSPAQSVSRFSATADYLESAFGLKRAQQEQKTGGFSGRDWLLLGGLVIVAHFVGVEGYLKSLHDQVIVPEKKKEVFVEFIKPEPPPPPKIEPPKPEPKPLPKPKLQKVAPPPKPVPALKTAPAEPDIKPQDIVVPENTQAQHTSAPVVAEPSPPPPPPEPPKEEPITEATGYAGYLNNPPPTYPSFAQRQGWEGKVILRVRVLSNGKPGSVELKQSSGRKTLDEAALEVVKSWTFAPAKRGNTPIDGWATVPIEFKLASR